jgi:hypothetical protein
MMAKHLAFRTGDVSTGAPEPASVHEAEAQWDEVVQASWSVPTLNVGGRP